MKAGRVVMLVAFVALTIFGSGASPTPYAAAQIPSVSAPAVITNVTVYVDSTGTAVYRLCVQAPDPNLWAQVWISPVGVPHPLVPATFSIIGGCGGSTTYMLAARFAGLTPGLYWFDGACAETAISLECVYRNSVFSPVGNQSVATGCQIDFNSVTRVPANPRNCTLIGTIGDITVISPPPPTPTATATNTPTATRTPGPSPTAIPTETATPGLFPSSTPTSPATPTPTDTPTPTNSPIPSDSPTSTDTPTPEPSPTGAFTGTATPSVTPVPSATPTVTSTPYTGPRLTTNTGTTSPLQQLAVTGEGFGVREPMVLYWDSVHTSPLTTTMTDSGGSFYLLLRVPQAIAGTHAVIGVGQRTIDSAAASVRITPEIIVTPTFGTPGTQVIVSGFGFAPQEIVGSYWDTPSRWLGPTTSNMLGSFVGSSAVTATVPLTAPVGQHVIYSIGFKSQLVGTAGFVVP